MALRTAPVLAPQVASRAALALAPRVASEVVPQKAPDEPPQMAPGVAPEVAPQPMAPALGLLLREAKPVVSPRATRGRVRCCTLWQAGRPGSWSSALGPRLV